MARRHAPFLLRIDPADARNLVDQGGLLQRDRLLLRVHGDMLTARWPSSGRYSVPPKLTARIERRPDGLVIDGTIRESFTDAMWQPAYLGLTIFMVALAVFGAVTLVTGYAAGGLPPLLIGLVAAVVFAALWRVFARLRQPAFDQAARDLEEGVRDAVTSGAAGEPTAHP